MYPTTTTEDRIKFTLDDGTEYDYLDEPGGGATVWGVVGLIAAAVVIGVLVFGLGSGSMCRYESLGSSPWDTMMRFTPTYWLAYWFAGCASTVSP